MHLIAGLQVTSRRPCRGQKQKGFYPLGNELYFDANFAKKFLLYWPPTWPPCHVVANQELVRNIYLERGLYFYCN